MAGGDGSSTSAPVRCSRAPRASRTTPRPRRPRWPYPITGVHGVAFSPYGKLLGIAGPRAPSCAVALGRHGRAGRLRFSSPGRGSTSLPGASAPCPGVTLSDAGGQGERRRTRRYGDVSNSLRILQESRTKMSRLIGLHGNAGYHDSTARDATSQPRSSKLSITAFAAIMAAPGGLRVPGRHWELQMPVFAVSRA
jgi:hypothetical protein